MPRIIKSFKKEYPDIRINLNRYRIRDLRTLLMDESLDVIFTFSFDLGSLYSIETIPIEKRKPCIVMSSNHPLADKPSISISDIVKEPLICYEKEESSGVQNITYSTCETIGFKPQSYIYAKNNDTIISLVSFNQGIAFMDKSICINNDLVAYDILPDEISFDIVAVWLKKNNKNSLLNFQKILV